MRIEGAVIVVTGGADGIGRALVDRFRAEGARAVVVADRNAAGAERVAAGHPGFAMACDVANEADIQALVARTEREFDAIDLFCSNAGVAAFGDAPDSAVAASNEQWQRGWQVHVMAHVYAARACLPGMVARGRGHFLHTISAAGLLNQIGGTVYGTTKHAAVGFAENLALTHRDQGIRVSILCPQAVDTPMLRAMGEGPQNVDGVLTPADVAEAAVHGLADDRFLILPHPQVLGYMRRKSEDYDRWIGGMVKFRRSLGS